MRFLPAVLALALSPVASAVPMELNHQGRLMNAAGVPLDGQHDLSIGLYDAPSSGVELWSADLVGVEFDNGYFAIELGTDPANPLDDSVFEGDDVYLGMAVDSGPPLPARPKLQSVPFAIRAGVSRDLEGGVVDAAEIRINGTTVIDGGGNVMGPGSLGSLSCGVGELAVYDGSAWGCGSDQVLDEAAVEAFVTNGALDLDAGTTLGGAAIQTGTDQVLDEAAVEAFVTNGALDLDAGTTLGGEAVATVAASDAAYVSLAGDTMTGALALDYAGAGITFNGAVADASAEWAISSVNGPEDFVIYEPEDGDKEHLRIVDGGDITLSPDGATALTASPSGAVSIAGAGDIGGDLVVGGTNGTIGLRGVGDGSQDFGIRAVGENFEIIEPEEGNEVNFRIVDDLNIQLRPNDTLVLQANANGIVDVPGSINGMLLDGCPAGFDYQYGHCMETTLNTATNCIGAIRGCNAKGMMLCPAFIVHVDDYVETGAGNSIGGDYNSNTLWLNTGQVGWGGSGLYPNLCVNYNGSANSSSLVGVNGGSGEYACCTR